MSFGRATVLILLLFSTSRPAGAQDVIQFDLSPHFNADVVVNNGTGDLDPTQDPIDLGVISSGNFCMMTQSVAEELAADFETPNGLPDSGAFAAGLYHPEVRFGIDNDKGDVNCRRVAGMTDSFFVDIPVGLYTEVHFFATTGDGSSQVTVELHYEDASFDSQSIIVPDWFDDPLESPDAYRLIDGMDRMNPGVEPGIVFDFEDSDDCAIHGFRFLPDVSKVLVGVQVVRTDSASSLNVFGMTGIREPMVIVKELYESTQAPGLLDPGNIVLRDVSSPLPWSPPLGVCCLYYKVDDGMGDPALIYVSKLDPEGLEIRF